MTLPVIGGQSQAAHELSNDYYCARRDVNGNVRLNCGRGVIIADAGVTRAEILERLFAPAIGGMHAAELRSVLRLMDEEGREPLVASRDEHQRIRVNGTLIAFAHHTREHIRAWVAEGKTPDKNGMYEAAIALIDQEAAGV